MVTEETLAATGFLTLTVGDQGEKGFVQIWDAKEASRRIDNLRRRVLSDLFERAIVVTERHKSGAIHFHIVGVLAGRPDIRTGFDFDAVRRGDYSSAGRKLRKLWAMLRERLPEYGFGRAELTPIEKTGPAIAGYVSKYIEKNIGQRREEDKGKKLVRYLGWDGRQLKPNDFGWATPRAGAWRANAAILAGLAGVRERSEVADAFGPRWAFRLSRVMNAVAGSDRDVCSEVGSTFPVRSTARNLVMREAKKKWVDLRRIRDDKSPVAWHPKYRPPTVRNQTEIWQTN